MEANLKCKGLTTEGIKSTVKKNKVSQLKSVKSIELSVEAW
jgi:hypothetical protein